MNSHPELDLLRDLAKLLTKYGPEAFVLLADRLISTEWRERLVALLTTVAGAAQQAAVGGSGGRPTALKALRGELLALAKDQPEKAGLLIQFHEALLAKKCLPTLRELEHFALGVGVGPLAVSSRPRAIAELVKQLSMLPLETFREKVEAASLGTEGDRGLMGWADIILNKDFPRKRAE